MRTRILTVLLLTGVLVGCGSEGTSPSDPADAGSAPKAPAVATPTVMPTAIPVPSGPVSTRSIGFVLGKIGEPAELCLGGVAESLPPQCGGPVLDGFDFDEYPGDFEEASNVRWGEFKITGKFDGTRIMVSKVVPADRYPRPEPTPEHDLFTSRCPEPEGGWAVVDPTMANWSDRSRAFDAARLLPDYAGAFIDNDPKPAVINIQVTGDPATAERELRTVWGGPLCVTRAKYTEKELLEIQQDMGKLPGMLSSGVQDNVMQVYVTYDDGTLQAWADSEYGPGLVKVSSALVPASG